MSKKITTRGSTSGHPPLEYRKASPEPQHDSLLSALVEEMRYGNNWFVRFFSVIRVSVAVLIFLGLCIILTLAGSTALAGAVRGAESLRSLEDRVESAVWGIVELCAGLTVPVYIAFHRTRLLLPIARVGAGLVGTSTLIGLPLKISEGPIGDSDAGVLAEWEGGRIYSGGVGVVEGCIAPIAAILLVFGGALYLVVWAVWGYKSSSLAKSPNTGPQADA